MELAHVALLRCDLALVDFDDDVAHLVLDKDGAFGEVRKHPADLVLAGVRDVRSLDRQGRVVGEVRDDCLDILGVHCIEVGMRCFVQRVVIPGHDWLLL